jgi:hypothetical protein
MADLIRFVLGNFTLTFLILGLVASAIALMRARKPITAPVVIEALFAYFLLFSIGVGFFYNFVFHTFFGELAAGFIGWEDSPFQAEVGFASLGFAVVGFLAFRRSSICGTPRWSARRCSSGALPAATSTRWSRPATSRPATPGSSSTPTS